MTTTLTAATLTVTLKESIELNGVEQGATNTKTIASVNEVSKRIVTVTTTEAEVMAFHVSAIASGTFIEGDVRYVRFTNLDDTNFVTLTFKNENDDEFAIKVDAGHSFIYPGDNSGGVVDTMDAIDGTGLTYALGDLVNVTADADTASCDMEIFVASV
tara:strand:- start:797 stop:1270 length:474 start_codon:yes stop_codon:yes gene_type:complete